MSRDLRRSTALIRDERRLQEALASHEAYRFDAHSADTVRERTEDLLETIAAVVADDDFWHRLERANWPLTSEQVDRLRDLDPIAFAALLDAAGYHSPPPPPVDELVDDTFDALATVLANPSKIPPPSVRISQARDGLITLGMRVRRQIVEPEPSQLESGVLRSSAQSLGRAARWLIPRTVAVSAGAVVEMHQPGSGFGFVLARSAQKFTEDSIELAVNSIVGRLPGAEELTRREPELDTALYNPLAVHTAAVADQLVALRRAADDLDADAAQHRRRLMRTAHRHVSRLAELLADRGRQDPHVLYAIQQIEDSLRGLESNDGLESQASGRVGRALEATQWLRENAPATYRKPFGE